MTTYFRTIFSVTSEQLAALTIALVEVAYDDGLIVYVNEQEIGRANMVIISTLINLYATKCVLLAWHQQPEGNVTRATLVSTMLVTTYHILTYYYHSGCQ